MSSAAQAKSSWLKPSCEIRLKPDGDSEAKPDAVPGEAGHHSEMKPDTVPK
jgi:hypothetical protein